MKVVVDNKIPYIQEPLEAIADEMVAKAGQDIRPADVRDADVLVVRTRTRCDRTLLEGSRVRLVLTATIGYDHLDTKYLSEAGIEWHNCPGCNATSVAQYVRNSLLLLQKEQEIRLGDCTLGIIGVGHVGTAVLESTLPLMDNILLNDPPRQERGDAPPSGVESGWQHIETLLERCDIITMHTPLTTIGNHPTLHLADASFFKHMNQGSVLINASRGEVVDEMALEQALDTRHLRAAVIDTWEHEPHINRSLLSKAYIGTPHIAGYSADGKANATRMVLTHLCAFLGRPIPFDIVPPPLPPGSITAQDTTEQALQLYDPRKDSALLKAHPDQFEMLRNNYPLRREKA